MFLILEVSSPQASSLGAARRRVFSNAGGTIGRAASSDWILSHRKVSGRHALVSYQDATFYIVDDSSANGVFLNSTKSRLIPGKRYALKSGDRIIIDPYEIDVTISSAVDQDDRRSLEGYGDRRRDAAGPLDPFGGADPFAPDPVITPAPARLTPPRPRATPAGEPVPHEEVDPLKLLEGGAAPRKTPSAPSARDLEGQPILSEHYQPPAIRTPPPEAAPPTPTPTVRPGPAFEIPADYDPLSDEPEDPFAASAPPAGRPARPTPPAAAPSTDPDWVATPRAPTPAPRAVTPVPTPSPPPVSASPPAAVPEAPPPPSPVPAETLPPSEEPGLRAVLEGAGLARAPVTPEFARSFGEIFRVVVSGVMDVLRARQQIKDEFRMRLTQFRQADNNPLKFSANVDDALHNLLVKRNPAYLEPVDAFEDAFDDLRSHQMAMLAGMRTAFESMLAQFSPESLQAQFDRQLKRTALLNVTARMKYWELYRDQFEAITKDPEAAFRRMFGDEFARAYEQQMQRLKADARRGDAPAARGTGSEDLV